MAFSKSKETEFLLKEAKDEYIHSRSVDQLSDRSNDEDLTVRKPTNLHDNTRFIKVMYLRQYLPTFTV